MKPATSFASRKHLYTVTPDEPFWAQAAQVMAEKDIGSLVVMELGDLVGMLTFREVIQAMVRNGARWAPCACALRWTMRH